MGAFLAEIGNTGLLTKDQEIEFTVNAKVKLHGRNGCNVIKSGPWPRGTGFPQLPCAETSTLAP
jgi:hypothetical protein